MSSPDASDTRTADTDPLHPTAKFSPEIDVNPDEQENSDSHPTMTVNRRTLGELAISPDVVTAGSKQNFKFTYKASEALVTDADGDGAVDVDTDADKAIEIKLPAGWPMPRPYQHGDDEIPAADADDEEPYVYLSGSASRLMGTIISVIPDPDTSVSDRGTIVRIQLGPKVCLGAAQLSLTIRT